RVYLVKLFHTQPRETTEYNVIRLGQRLADGGYSALIMDYRQAEINHGARTYEAIVDAFAAALPRGLIMVYLHDGESFVFARLMTTLLQDRGIKVGRAHAFDSAWNAILKALTSRAE
ncbi:MAG: hypothetical protein ACOC0V_03835, partial [Oceanicaulis sp.]